MQSNSKSIILTHSDKASSRAKAIALEEEILQFSGLVPYKDISITDVSISFSEENFIHTYHCGNKENKTLVLIHGYGGSSALFYSILKDLSNEFSVYCIDLLGMGLSSRPDFTSQTPEEAIAYFVDSIEKWREAVGIKEFYLGGHSFGAYMAINYTIKYRELVKKLILISPIGITADQDPYAFMEWVNQMGWIKKKMYKMYIKLWEDKATPFEFLQKHSFIGGFILKKYLEKQYKGVENSHKIISLLEKMFFKLAKLPAGSEKALHCLFGPPLAIPKISMEYELFEHVSVPTHFFYGEADWVDWLGAHRLANSEVKMNFTFKWIKDSGHQIFASKPKEIAKEIIEVLKE